MKALLVESITQSKTTKSTTMWTREGDFEPIETVKERYRDQPERWALIEKNAPRITCDVTGEELIVEPQYKLKVTDEEVCMEEKKRRIEGEATCKNPKKAKTAKAIKAVGGADETPTVVPEPQVALQLFLSHLMHFKIISFIPNYLDAALQRPNLCS